MRFRYVLPIVGAFAAIAFVLVPLRGYSPNYKGADGKEIVCHDNCRQLPSLFGIDSISFAKSMNLPATPLCFLLLQIWWDHSHHFPSAFWQGMAYGFAGVLLWFFVGRAVDDVFSWRRAKTPPSIHVSDLVFSTSAALVPTLFAVAIAKPFDNAGWWMFASITVWILIGWSTVIMRAMQLVRASSCQRASKLSD